MVKFSNGTRRNFTIILLLTEYKVFDAKPDQSWFSRVIYLFCGCHFLLWQLSIGIGIVIIILPSNLNEVCAWKSRAQMAFMSDCKHIKCIPYHFNPVKSWRNPSKRGAEKGRLVPKCCVLCSEQVHLVESRYFGIVYTDELREINNRHGYFEYPRKRFTSQQKIFE